MFLKKNRVLKEESGRRISKNVKNIERTVYGQIRSYLEIKEQVSITEIITLYVTLLNDENIRIARGTILSDYLNEEMKKSMPFNVRDCVSGLRENRNQEDNEKRGTFPKVRKFPSDQIDLSV